jgi:hypothetical protein
LTVVKRRLNDLELQTIASYLTKQLNPDGAANLYQLHVSQLLGENLLFRGERQTVLTMLKQLPLEDVKLEDGPVEIAEKAQAFWLEYQRGLWEQGEAMRLKRANTAKDREKKAAEQRADRLQERIDNLERAYTELQQERTALQESVRELTENLQASATREASHAQRVRVLEEDREERERQHALELTMARDAHANMSDAYRQAVRKATEHMDEAKNIMAAATP